MKGFSNVIKYFTHLEDEQAARFSIIPIFCCLENLIMKEENKIESYNVGVG